MAAPCVTVGKVRARLVFDAETVEDQPSQKENKTNASLVTPFEQAFLEFPSNSSILSSPEVQGDPLSGFDSDATEEQKVPRSRKFVKLLDKFDAAESEMPLFDMQLSLRLNAIAVMEKHKQSRQEKNLSVLELDRALDELRNNAPTLLDISLRPSTLTAEDEARMAEEDKISSDRLRRLNREWAEGGRECSRKLAKLEQQVDEMVESEAREVSYLIAAEEGRKQDTTW